MENIFHFSQLYICCCVVFPHVSADKKTWDARWWFISLNLKHKLATFSNLALTVEIVFLNLVNNTSTASHFGPNEICFICPKLRLLSTPQIVFVCFSFFNSSSKKTLLSYTMYSFALIFTIGCASVHLFTHRIWTASVLWMKWSCWKVYVVTVQSFGISNKCCSWFNGFCLRRLIGQAYSLPVPLQKHSWQKKKKKKLPQFKVHDCHLHFTITEILLVPVIVFCLTWQVKKTQKGKSKPP